MAIPANHNLGILWATDKAATVVSERMAGGVQVTPIATVDSALSVASQVPRRTVIGVTYSIGIRRAFWDKAIDDLFGLNEEKGWVSLFDETMGVALLQPAQLIVRPRGALTADPASTVRSDIQFVPVEDDRRPFHVAPDLAGASTRATVTLGTGIAFATASGATKLAVTPTAYTFTAAPGA